jgi:hypothetical protein
MSKEKLLDDIDTIVGEIDQIRTQLSFAKSNAAAHKEYSNPDWFNNAQAALRIKGRQHQKMQNELGRLNKLEKQQYAKRLEACFVKAARELLPHVKFIEIMDMAKLDSEL